MAANKATFWIKILISSASLSSSSPCTSMSRSCLLPSFYLLYGKGKFRQDARIMGTISFPAAFCLLSVINSSKFREINRLGTSGVGTT